MAFGYRLMRGRQGMSGHVRGMGEKALLSVQGLQPGEECVLYALRDSGGAALDRQTAGRDGRAQFMAGAEERLFLAVQGRVTLWEDGPDAEGQYLLASAWLRKEREKEAAPAADEAPHPAPAPRREETRDAAVYADAPDTEKTAEEEDGAAPEQPAQEGRAYALRPPGTGEAVDALPILRWPLGTEDLRLNCTLRPPFAPLRAPGWRFVQVPSPLPRIPSCAVGYRALDARVTEIAYAIPGPPHQPPVAMPGYHYRPGRHDTGYWVMTKRV